MTADRDDRDRDPRRRSVVDVGAIGAEPTASPLPATRGVEVPDDLPAEGYALAAFTARRRNGGERRPRRRRRRGTFYAAQTLRQLSRPTRGRRVGRGVGVVDRPAMRHRGAIEGFYGSPWTQQERLDQLAFYGRFKLNTYVYAPKDDPYHRDRWREPYPPDRLADLRTLIDAAAANHVRFTFAVSPGVSICYSDPADLDALVAKLDAVYAAGGARVLDRPRRHRPHPLELRRRPHPLRRRPPPRRRRGPRSSCSTPCSAASSPTTHGRAAPADGPHRVPRHRRQPLPAGAPRAARPRGIEVMWTGADGGARRDHGRSGRGRRRARSGGRPSCGTTRRSTTSRPPRAG